MGLLSYLLGCRAGDDVREPYIKITHLSEYQQEQVETLLLCEAQRHKKFKRWVYGFMFALVAILLCIAIPISIFGDIDGALILFVMVIMVLSQIPKVKESLSKLAPPPFSADQCWQISGPFQAGDEPTALWFQVADETIYAPRSLLQHIYIRDGTPVTVGVFQLSDSDIKAFSIEVQR